MNLIAFLFYCQNLIVLLINFYVINKVLPSEISSTYTDVKKYDRNNWNIKSVFDISVILLIATIFKYRILKNSKLLADTSFIVDSRLRSCAIPSSWYLSYNNKLATKILFYWLNLQGFFNLENQHPEYKQILELKLCLVSFILINKRSGFVILSIYSSFVI